MVKVNIEVPSRREMHSPRTRNIPGGDIGRILIHGMCQSLRQLRLSCRYINLRTALFVSQEALRGYNVEVAEDHTYGVGTAGVLVHNKPLEFINLPDAPVGKLTKLNEARFNQRGLAGEQHALKEAVGARPNAHFDIFKDRDGNRWVLPKGGTGEPQGLQGGLMTNRRFK